MIPYHFSLFLFRNVGATTVAIHGRGFRVVETSKVYHTRWRRQGCSSAQQTTKPSRTTPIATSVRIHTRNKGFIPGQIVTGIRMTRLNGGARQVVCSLHQNDNFRLPVSQKTCRVVHTSSGRWRSLARMIIGAVVVFVVLVFFIVLGFE
jgi:hypothetical protein